MTPKFHTCDAVNNLVSLSIEYGEGLQRVSDAEQDLLLAKAECNSILEAHREALNIVTELVGGCNLVPEAVN